MPIKKFTLGDWIVYSVLAVGFCLLCYGSLIEPNMLNINTVTVSTKKWTHPKPLKIAVLTDLHMTWPWMTVGHMDNIVENTNQQAPDIIVLLGDYVGTRKLGIEIKPDLALAPLKKLSAKCGTYAVLGNHDMHPPGDWPDALKRTGIPVLENRSIPIDCNGQRMWISGLEDLWWQKPSINKTLEQVTDDAPVIMLTHNPDIFVDMPSRAALTLAGHTHAGQLQFPFIGAIKEVVPSKYGLRFLYGHIQENGNDMVVSSGLGCTGIPIRLMVPPEIMMVTLQKQ